MKIEFELTDKQEAALNELMPFMQRNPKPTPNEIANDVFISYIITNTQKLVEQELRSRS